MDSTLSLEDELQDVINTEDICFHYTILWDNNLGEGLSGLVRLVMINLERFLFWLLLPHHHQ